MGTLLEKQGIFHPNQNLKIAGSWLEKVSVAPEICCLAVCLMVTMRDADSGNIALAIGYLAITSRNPGKEVVLFIAVIRERMIVSMGISFMRRPLTLMLGSPDFGIIGIV